MTFETEKKIKIWDYSQNVSFFLANFRLFKLRHVYFLKFFYLQWPKQPNSKKKPPPADPFSPEIITLLSAVKKHEHWTTAGRKQEAETYFPSKQENRLTEGGVTGQIQKFLMLTNGMTNDSSWVWFLRTNENTFKLVALASWVFRVGGFSF